MYIRFVSARPHPLVAAEAGIFDAYWRVQDNADPRLNRPSSKMPRHRSLRRRWIALLDAADELSRLAPPQVRGKGRIRGANRALFWFKQDARWWDTRSPGTVVLSARELAHQLSFWGVEIREISTHNPGRVLWENSYQVLAAPADPVPRAFV